MFSIMLSVDNRRAYRRHAEEYVYIYNKCLLGTAASAGSSASISRRPVDTQSDEHKLILHNILNCTCRSVSFFQLADGARVASIPRHIQRFCQVGDTVFPLFQVTLKTAASTHKCGNTLPQKNQFSVASFSPLYC
jgi:hypothetical protein